jgi:predicted cupin superfamily sugar epimerase
LTRPGNCCLSFLHDRPGFEPADPFPGRPEYLHRHLFPVATGSVLRLPPIASDEIWHFYSGGPLLIHEISHGGTLITHKLGGDPEAGQKFFTVIKAGSWFASVPATGAEYCLAGCTVAPGFDFADLELAERATLNDRYPEHAELIHALTRIP